MDLFLCLLFHLYLDKSHWEMMSHFQQQPVFYLHSTHKRIMNQTKYDWKSVDALISVSGMFELKQKIK